MRKEREAHDLAIEIQPEGHGRLADVSQHVLPIDEKLVGELDLHDSHVGLQESPSVISKPSSTANSPDQAERQARFPVDKRLELDKMATTDHHVG